MNLLSIAMVSRGCNPKKILPKKKKKKIYYRGHKNKTFITDTNHNANHAAFILTFCSDFGHYKRPISYCISARNTCPKEPKIERDEMQEKES